MELRAAKPFRALQALGLGAALLLVGGCSDGKEAVDGSTAAETMRPSPSAPPAAPESETPSSKAEQHPGAAAPSASTDTGGNPAAGALAENFPELLGPILEDSTIEVSTVDTTDGVTTVSLVAGTSVSQKEVLAHFSELLVEHGFEALGSDSIDGTASQTFSRRNAEETVTISAVQSGAATTYTLGAHLLAASAK